MVKKEYETPKPVQLTIKGLPELQAKFKALGLNFPDALSATMLAAALEVAGIAAVKAPWLFGDLSRSITASPKDHKVIYQEMVTTGTGSALVITNKVYAAYQEFLWDNSPGPHKSNKGPFLRPALYDSQKHIEDQMGNSLRAVAKAAEV